MAGKKLRTSYSAISCFQACRRAYYFSRVRRLERICFTGHFLLGNAIHEGLFQIYVKNKHFLRSTMRFFNKEKQRIRKEISLQPYQEQELYEQEPIIKGMLTAYCEVHKKLIRSMKHIENEYELDYDIDPYTTIRIKVDNLLEEKKSGATYIHEVKTTRTLSKDYVKSIKNNLQKSIYFHVFNAAPENKKSQLTGICYDAIQKPSIRLKKKENKQQFIERLFEYYTGTNKSQLFYFEKFKKLQLTKHNVFNLISKVSRDIRACKDVDDFYPNYALCNMYSRCEFYDICHFGENAVNMANFRVRPIRKTGTKNKKK